MKIPYSMFCLGSDILSSELTRWTIVGTSVKKSTGNCVALRVISRDQAELTTAECGKNLPFVCQYGM